MKLSIDFISRALLMFVFIGAYLRVFSKWASINQFNCVFFPLLHHRLKNKTPSFLATLAASQCTNTHSFNNKRTFAGQVSGIVFHNKHLVQFLCMRTHEIYSRDNSIHLLFIHNTMWEYNHPVKVSYKWKIMPLTTIGLQTTYISLNITSLKVSLTFSVTRFFSRYLIVYSK